MSKITKDQKEKIARRAAEFAFKKRKEVTARREAKLAVECYNHIFAKKIRDAINACPDGWLRKCKCLQFNVGGWSVTLCSESEYPTPYSNHCGNLGNIPAGELCDKVQAHVQEVAKNKEDYSKLYYKILSMLTSFNSFKAMRENWVEGVEFYKDMDVDRVSPQLPANIISDINKQIGL